MSASDPASRPSPITSKSGQRVHPRIDIPLTVEINGVRHVVADWSLGGFGLEASAPDCEAGDVFKCRLIFIFPHVEATLTLLAKAVRVVDGKGRGFQFVDMTADQAEALSYIVDNYLSGDIVTVAGLASHGMPPEISFSDETTRRMRAVSAALRLGAILVVTIGVAAFGAVSLLSSFLTVQSEYAAVASDRIVMRAPQAGFLLAATATTGETVTRDSVLFEISAPVNPQDIAALEQEIVSAQKQIELEVEHLSDVEAAFGSWVGQLQADIAAADTRVRLMTSEVAVRQRLFDRRAGLAKDGRAAAVQVDEAEVALRQAQIALADEKATLQRLRDELKFAGAGLYLGDTRATRQTPGDVRRSLAERREQLSAKEATLRARQARFVVRSPCDCVVEMQGARDGEYVEAGTAVYGLGDGHDQGTEVDVLLPIDQVRYLRIGGEARVLLSDQAEEIDGRIARINFNPRNTGRTGLPEQLRAVSRFALVTVTLPPSMPRPVSGVPAIVAMRIHPGDLLFKLTGIGWFTSDVNPGEPTT